jgi:hypothetical protein
MTGIGQPERATQNRVLTLFRNELGYRYLGDWSDREGNSNIEEGLLSAWLTKSGYTAAQSSAALYRLRTEADNHSRTLGDNNKAVYSLLRYGVQVKTDATGIANAIAEQLRGLKGNRDAIAETIENNVRSKIIKEHLSDPAYYEKMSALLDEIIGLRKAKAIEYEEYLRRVALLARGVEVGLAEDTPEPLKNSPALRALYNNLKRPEETAAGPGGTPTLELAVELDAAIRRESQDGWRGVQTREQVIKAALYEILKDEAEVERIFRIIEAQSEY